MLGALVGVALCVVLASAALAASTNFVELATSPEAAGPSPRALVVRDFDGDGDRDLALADPVASGVTLLRNSGSGNFRQPASSPEPAGNGAGELAAADFDGDGDPDLATANFTSEDLTVLRNNGSGNFREPASSPESAGDRPLSPVAADLDGDLDPDLAVANPDADTVTVLRNRGSGNFVIPGSSPAPAGDKPLHLAAADLDTDGDVDLVAANRDAQTVTILHNNGRAGFTAVGSEGTGVSPDDVLAADLDGDGDRDLAVACFSSNEVTILRNNGSGGFHEPGSSPVPSGGTVANDLAAADFELDGDLDLAVANQATDNVGILRNNGGGAFAHPASSPEPAGDGPISVVAAPLDGDEDADLAVANVNEGTVSILRNR